MTLPLETDRLVVAILNQYALPSGAAGITRHGDLGAELTSRGHQVTVIASAFDYFARAGQERPQTSDHSGVRFVWFNTGGYVRNDRRRVASMVMFCMKAAWATIRARPRPDIIIGSSPHLLAALAARVAAGLIRRPWVFEIRDFWPSALVDLGAIRRGSPTHRALGWLERTLYASADAIVAVPPHGYRRLEELGMDAAAVSHIPNSAALASESETVPSSLQRDLEGIGERFLIVYAGQLGVTHDLPTIIRAVARIRETHPPQFARLAMLFVGDGVERELIVSLAKDLGLTNVLFHPPIPKGAVRSLLESADACLMAAGGSDYFKYGLSPNKLFDYFAASKPVLIAADLPTIADEAGAGIRYRPGDPQAFADAVVQMIELPKEERAEMGRRGRELVETQYSIPVITDRYESLLQEVVARHRAR